MCLTPQSHLGQLVSPFPVETLLFDVDPSHKLERVADPDAALALLLELSLLAALQKVRGC
jgi:hypothetical protein